MEKMKTKKTRKLKGAKVSDFVIAGIILLLSLTCVLPFLHVGSKSISSNTAVLSKSVYLLPKDINFNAYVSIFKDGQLTYSMIYSVGVTLAFTALGMVLTICAAYPLSRKRLLGRSWINFFMLFTMYFAAGLIPEYLLYKSLNILNTPWVLILPLCFSPYNMLIMRSFFSSSIPDSLEEAAFLDAATNFQFLRQVVLPLSKPILATISLFYATGRWNAYADAKYFITKKSLQPIQYLLSNMVLSSGSDAVSLSEGSAVTSTPEVLSSATIMFATIPIILVYPFIQKYFVQGVMVGSIKE